MMIRGIVALCLSAWAAAPAGAAQYYYVSAPYIESNYDTDTPPVITTGLLEIDESLVPGGLANSQLRIDDFGGQEPAWQDINPAVKGLVFTNGEITMDRVLSNYGVSLYFNFDANGEIETAGGVFGEEYADGWSNDMLMPDSHSERYHGSSNGTRGHYSSAAVTGFHKVWFSDALEWAAEVAKRTLYAVSNPPSNACRISAADLQVEDFIPA